MATVFLQWGVKEPENVSAYTTTVVSFPIPFPSTIYTLATAGEYAAGAYASTNQPSARGAISMAATILIDSVTKTQMGVGKYFKTRFIALGK